MDFLEADQILSDYGDVLANSKTGPHISINELKNTKEEIVLAFKIWYIHMVKYNTLSPKNFDIHHSCIYSLGLFGPDEESILLNEYSKAITNHKLKEFTENHPGIDELSNVKISRMLATDEHEEVMEFVDSIKELDNQDPLYYQRAYTLANVEYKTEYKETFDNPQAAYNKRIEKTYRFNDREISTPKKNNQVSNKRIDLVKNEEAKINSTNDYKEVKWISFSLIVLIAILMLVYYVK